MFVLTNSSQQPLLNETLYTLEKFLQLKWIPIPIIFESHLIEALALRYYGIQLYRNPTLGCLIEISNINIVGGKMLEEKLVNVYMSVLTKTFNEYQLHLNTNINDFLMDDCNFDFLQNFINFLSTFLSNHRLLLEKYNRQSCEALKAGLKLFLNITNINHVQYYTIFSICVDFWELIARDLKNILPTQSSHSPMNNSSFLKNNERYQIYIETIHDLKFILMNKIPRPKEVLIVRDDNGNVIKQEMKNTCTLALHQQICKILHILSFIDPNDTREVIGYQLNRFQELCNKNVGNGQNSNFGRKEGQICADIEFDSLNSLCWSIGAVAGSMPSNIEKSFLVVVIKILLNLCETQKTKNAKAIIASNIMYVVRKYPRFLKRHWKFLQTVVRKLVEFLCEQHPGVQDMSIETLHEICIHCGQKFICIQENDRSIFLQELISTMSNNDIICKLDNEQIQNLYSTWATIIAYEWRKDSCMKYLSILLQIPNNEWQQLMNNSSMNGNIEEYYANKAVIERFIHLLRIYRKCCKTSGGRIFLQQMTSLYTNLLQLYTGYAQSISRIISESGEQNLNARNSPQIRAMMTIKSEILQLFEIFIKTFKNPKYRSTTVNNDGYEININSNESIEKDENGIVCNLVPKFLETVLQDYKNSLPIAREYNCLTACTALILNLESKIIKYVPNIFDCIFQITLDMISGSMEDYPDHRREFFVFLYAVTKKCFNVFLNMNNEQISMIINCILWAEEHIDIKICEIGVQTLYEFIKNIKRFGNGDGKLVHQFYKNFTIIILKKIINVMTDTLHKSIFPQICRVFKLLMNDIQNEAIVGQLYVGDDDHKIQYNNNKEFIAHQLNDYFLEQFPHLTNDVNQNLIIGFFQLSTDELDGNFMNGVQNININGNDGQMKKKKVNVFQQHCEDFLVQIKTVHHSNENTGGNSNQNSNPGSVHPDEILDI